MTTLTCPRCNRSNELRDAMAWGSRFRCECGALLATGNFPTEVAIAATGAPPPFLPRLPLQPSRRMVFGVRQPRSQLSLTRCEHCRATLGIDGNVSARVVLCAECGKTSRHPDASQGPFAFVPFEDLGGAFADFAARALDQSRFSVPLREPPTRSWLELEDGAVEPLLSDTPSVICVDGGWFFAEGQSRAPLSSGDPVGPQLGRWFGQSGAFEPPAHYEPLDERPTDPSAWLVWADHLEEQASPLIRWLRLEKRPNIALADQLGFLAPLVRRGRAVVTWNRFGFCDSLRLDARTFAAYPFALDASFVPAMRYATELAIDAPDAGAFDALATTLTRATLPRALRRLVVRGPGLEAPRLEPALVSVRQRCPWFGR